MILRRIGNKARIAADIVPHFPPHTVFIDMFFGAGGIFFNKPLARHNFCNDLDDDVFNLWTVFMHRKEELIEKVELMPVSDSLFQHWRKNKETDPILKAVRFLMLSNFGYMGKTETMKVGCAKSKAALIKNMLHDFKDTFFTCEDFRDVIKKASIDADERVFIYCDPPYLETTDTYSNSFTEQDTSDLFDVCLNSGYNFAISELKHPFVLELVKNHNEVLKNKGRREMEVIVIGERQSLKKRDTEILIVNYESPALYSLFRNGHKTIVL